jgi:hypothetical protein
MNKKEQLEIWYVMAMEDMSEKAWNLLADTTRLHEYKEEYYEFVKFLENRK